MNNDAQKAWDEIRIAELRKKISAMRVKARVNVGYYAKKAQGLQKKIRWSTAISAFAGVSVAGLVPWVGTSWLKYVAAALALVGPWLISWAKAKGWATDLSAYIKARDLSHAMEKEIEFLLERIDLRAYESTSDMIQQYNHLQQKWEVIGHVVPPEVPDVDVVKILRLKAEKSLGLKRNDGAEEKDTTANAETTA